MSEQREPANSENQLEPARTNENQREAMSERERVTDCDRQHEAATDGDIQLGSVDDNDVKMTSERETEERKVTDKMESTSVDMGRALYHPLISERLLILIYEYTVLNHEKIYSFEWDITVESLYEAEKKKVVDELNKLINEVEHREECTVHHAQKYFELLKKQFKIKERYGDDIPATVEMEDELDETFGQLDNSIIPGYEPVEYPPFSLGGVEIPKHMGEKKKDNRGRHKNGYVKPSALLDYYYTKDYVETSEMRAEREADEAREVEKKKLKKRGGRKKGSGKGKKKAVSEGRGKPECKNPPVSGKSIPCILEGIIRESNNTESSSVVSVMGENAVDPALNTGEKAERKKGSGRPLGSTNVKATARSDREVVIRDKEIVARKLPTYFEQFLFQYSRKNRNISSAQWEMNAAKELKNMMCSLRESVGEYVKDWMEINSDEIVSLRKYLEFKIKTGQLPRTFETVKYPESATNANGIDAHCQETYMNYMAYYSSNKSVDVFIRNLLCESSINETLYATINEPRSIKLPNKKAKRSAFDFDHEGTKYCRFEGVVESLKSGVIESINGIPIKNIYDPLYVEKCNGLEFDGYEVDENEVPVNTNITSTYHKHAGDLSKAAIVQSVNGIPIKSYLEPKHISPEDSGLFVNLTDVNGVSVYCDVPVIPDKVVKAPRTKARKSVKGDKRDKNNGNKIRHEVSHQGEEEENDENVRYIRINGIGSNMFNLSVNLDQYAIRKLCKNISSNVNRIVESKPVINNNRIIHDDIIEVPRKSAKYVPPVNVHKPVIASSNNETRVIGYHDNIIGKPSKNSSSAKIVCNSVPISKFNSNSNFNSYSNPVQAPIKNVMISTVGTNNNNNGRIIKHHDNIIGQYNKKSSYNTQPIKPIISSNIVKSNNITRLPEVVYNPPMIKSDVKQLPLPLPLPLPIAKPILSVKSVPIVKSTTIINQPLMTVKPTAIIKPLSIVDQSVPIKSLSIVNQPVPTKSSITEQPAPIVKPLLSPSDDDQSVPVIVPVVLKLDAKPLSEVKSEIVIDEPIYGIPTNKGKFDSYTEFKTIETSDSIIFTTVDGVIITKFNEIVKDVEYKTGIPWIDDPNYVPTIVTKEKSSLYIPLEDEVNYAHGEINNYDNLLGSDVYSTRDRSKKSTVRLLQNNNFNDNFSVNLQHDYLCTDVPTISDVSEYSQILQPTCEYLHENDVLISCKPKSESGSSSESRSELRLELELEPELESSDDTVEDLIIFECDESIDVPKTESVYSDLTGLDLSSLHNVIDVDDMDNLSDVSDLSNIANLSDISYSPDVSELFDVADESDIPYSPDVSELFDAADESDIIDEYNEHKIEVDDIDLINFDEELVTHDNINNMVNNYDDIPELYRDANLYDNIMSMSDEDMYTSRVYGNNTLISDLNITDVESTDSANQYIENFEILYMDTVINLKQNVTDLYNILNICLCVICKIMYCEDEQLECFQEEYLELD